jgi:tricarballylate dehydrogenase
MGKVVVVGGGNAALCAAISAREAGAEVVLVERAPLQLRGGNSAFTAGLMRTVYDGADDIVSLLDSPEAVDLDNTEFGSYTEGDFYDTLARLTEYRSDPELADTLVRESHQTLRWMKDHGVKFAPSYGRQAFKHENKFKFFGGAVVEVVGGGPGLVDSLYREAERMGITVRYQTRAVRLVHEEGTRGAVTGVLCEYDGREELIEADAVVLGAGGFQSNVEWRAKYLGPGWDLAKVRGTRFNTGDGIAMAREAGASAAGNWTGCHAVAWDRNAPEFGDLAVGDGFQKHSYPFGVIVNQAGKRFVDEGADFRNYTYAKYGQEILKQPGQTAWQIFDSQTSHLLRDEYRIRQVTKVSAPTLEGLVAKMDGVDGKGLLATIEEFNAAVDRSVGFNPNILDGRGTVGLALPKSNWAMPLEQGPFEAYQVTCGITFTFGGIRADVDARAIDSDGRAMPNLFVCGEMLGGLFYLNYPGGSGLTAGSVFGRIGGRNAAAVAMAEPAVPVPTS